MKPEEIPQWAWDAAGEAWMQQVKWDEDRIVCDNITPIALALIEARSQAFEEAARIADCGCNNPGCERDEIAQAIRQHSQKGRDNDL